MKKIILGLFFSLIFVCQTIANTFNIAALINGDIISNEDINSQINIFMLNSPIPLNDQTKDMITHRVMSQTIEQKLKLQAAAKENISVDETDIENQMNIWAKKNNISLSSLKSKNINKSTLYNNIKAELAWIKLVRKKFFQTSHITQKEINTAIDEITKISLKASFKFAHSRFSVIFCSDFSISAQRFWPICPCGITPS